MKSISFFAAFMLLFFFVGTQDVYGQKENIEVKSQPVANTRGANPNIKTERPTADATSRGAASGTCKVYFDNYTSYDIDVYVDGNWKGTLSAYGSGTIYVGSGYTTIYMQSVGKTREWFAKGNCEGSYTYTIR